MRLTVGGFARPLTIGGLAIGDLLTNRGFRNCAIRLAIEAMTIEGSGEWPLMIGRLAQSPIVIPAITQCPDEAIVNRMPQCPNRPIGKKSSVANRQSTNGRGHQRQGVAM
jgi:hypothetical protein